MSGIPRIERKHTRTSHGSSRNGIDNIVGTSNPGAGNLLTRRIHTHALTKVRERTPLVVDIDRTNRKNVGSQGRKGRRRIAGILVLISRSDREVDTGSGGLFDGFVEGGRASSRSERHRSNRAAKVGRVLAFVMVGDNPVNALEDIGGSTRAIRKDLDGNDIGGLCKAKGS